MKVRTAAALFACLAAGLVGVTAAPAHADASTCTQTVPASPSTPAPGAPCWTDATPYPFGFDGNPVQPTSPSPACQAWAQEHSSGDPIGCYLSVDSMAFRAWNRGIAVTSPAPNSGLSTTPFGVWLYNGTRWFPDPTFPGQSVCQGRTALWAGKLDYWVVGQISGASNWPALCRFDGVNFEWEPLAVPKAALAHVPLDSTGKPSAGAIKTGACFAWNDCWFFGSFGVVLRWDGQSLTDATPDTADSPWLRSNFTAAIARTDAGGNPFAFAVGNPFATTSPDGTPSDRVWHSSGRAFTPVDGSSFQSPLVAVDFNSQAEGWVAGDPAGQPPPSGTLPTSGASPLTCLSASGAVLDTDSFTNSPSVGYLWSSVSVLPNGDALAGGQYGSAGTFQVPVLAEVSCDPNQQARTLSFGSGGLAADDPAGWVTAVAANAVNDEWAATATAQFNANPPSPRPHLYHLTDTETPLAPAGDDMESRPIATQIEATIFQFAPPVVIPPPPAAPAPQPGKTTITRVKARPPIYAVQPPKLARISSARFSLSIRFKVRSKVTIGLEALSSGKVVSKSGLKTFRGKRGELVLALDVNEWPTSLKFVFPKKRGQK
jgi:hypothetical protein